MGVYAVTGAASGMGKAIVEKLEAEGHKVIGVDLRDVAVIADLSTPEGRAQAVTQVLEQSNGNLSGAVLAAGVGPIPKKEVFPVIGAVNYLGVVDLLKGWQPALAADGGAKVVVIGSNSTTATPMISQELLNAFEAQDMAQVVETVAPYGERGANLIYAGSKTAIAHWVRKETTKREWAGAGINVNILSPGAILTPLLERQLANPEEAQAIKAFPVPAGGFGKPEHIAAWTYMMLSPMADFMVGSNVFIDGGSDAYLRPTDWPRSVPDNRIEELIGKMKPLDY